MNFTKFSPETNTAMHNAEKTSRGWELTGNGAVGGTIYEELSKVYGPNGVQAALIGEQITITWESPAYADLEKLHARLDAGEDEGKDPSEMNAYELRKYDEAKADENEAKAAELDDMRGQMIPAPVNGGADPEDMNEKRRAWGEDLAERCRDLTGTDAEDAVSDAICYLLHVAEQYGETPARAVERAILHYNDETFAYETNVAAE